MQATEKMRVLKENNDIWIFFYERERTKKEYKERKNNTGIF